jgi:hypothetical protein
MKDQLEIEKAKEAEANPALAARIAELAEIAARKKEEAERLPTDERTALKDKMNRVFATATETGERQLVQNLLLEYKQLVDAAKALKKDVDADELHTQEQADAADTQLVLA